MEEHTYYWQPFDKGFYIALSEVEDFVGFALTMAYIPSVKDLQFMLHMGTVALAIGWSF